MKKELEKVYDPKQVEDKTYRFWLEKRYFHAEPNPKKKPYTIVIPPPNITGQLHLGHALDCTLQDSIICFKRGCRSPITHLSRPRQKLYKQCAKKV